MGIIINRIMEFIARLWVALTINRRWLFLAGVSAGLALAALILFLPLWTITEEKVQIYYETELKRETCPISESYESLERVTKTTQLANGNYTVVPLGIVIPFKIEQSSARLTGSFDNSIAGKFSVTRIGDKPVWEIKGNRGSIDVELPEGEYNAIFREDVMWGEACYMQLTLQWNEYETVTRYRTVNTYKDIPVLVEKQRVVTEKINVSLWTYIFGRG